jgi:hypothetical protein
VGQIVWSEAAELAMKRLGPAVRSGVERRLGYLQCTPRMYARADDTRHPGCRSFWVDDLCQVYYMVAAGGDDCFIMAIEEVMPEPEEVGSTGCPGEEQEF